MQGAHSVHWESMQVSGEKKTRFYRSNNMIGSFHPWCFELTRSLTCLTSSTYRMPSQQDMTTSFPSQPFSRPTTGILSSHSSSSPTLSTNRSWRSLSTLKNRNKPFWSRRIHSTQEPFTAFSTCQQPISTWNRRVLFTIVTFARSQSVKVDPSGIVAVIEREIKRANAKVSCQSR